MICLKIKKGYLAAALLPSLFIFFVVVSIFISGSERKDVSAASACDFNNVTSNQIILPESCTIDNGGAPYAFEGPNVNNDLVIGLGKVLTIGANTSLVLRQGQKIYVTGGQIIVNKNQDGVSSGANNNGAILRGALYLPDSDADGHPDSVNYAYSPVDTSPSITIGETSYIAATAEVINQETGVVNLDCAPEDPLVFEKTNCVMGEKIYTSISTSTCGADIANRLTVTKQWTRAVVTPAACGGTPCTAESGTDIDQTATCGGCTAGATQYNYCGTGACARSQLVTCTSGGEWPTTCTAGTAGAETCNGIDDNCDGIKDNGISNRTRYYTGTNTCGNYCLNESQSCVEGGSGTWTGTYTGLSCTASTRTGYQNASPCNTDCVGESQTCLSGGWSGTYTNASCAKQNLQTWYRDADSDGYGDASNVQYDCSQPSGYVSNSNDCNDANFNVKNTSSRTRYAASSVGCGTACSSELQTCSNGTWSGTYSLSDCTAHTRTRYQDAAPCGGTCVSETQTCQTSGYFDGTYTNSSCSVTTPTTYYYDKDNDNLALPTQASSTTACSDPEYYAVLKTDCNDNNAAVLNTKTRVSNVVLTVACGTACTTETQTCTEGDWGGAVWVGSCTASTRTKYKDSAMCDSACLSETQTCQTNGQFNGTYTNDSCTYGGASANYYLDNDGDGYGTPNTVQFTCFKPSGYVANSNDCDDNNASITTSSSTTKYKASAVTCGTACQSETRSCSNGVWSGTYTADSCTPATRTRYQYASTCGGSCTSQIQTCQIGGSFDGTYTNDSCSVTTPTTYYYDADNDNEALPSQSSTTSACSDPDYYASSKKDCDDTNLSITTSSSRTMYAASSVGCSSSCSSQSQTCSNGTWSGGTYAYSSCSATTCGSGTYCNSGTCTTCPAGSYCVNGVKTACAAGTYTSTTGQTSCTSCAAGTYNTGTGNTSCTTCQAGYYCTGGTNKTACPTGTYRSSTGGTALASCTSCAAGTYNTGTANTSSCSTCLAGYACAGGNNVTQCGDGYMSDAGASSCTGCLAGAYCPNSASVDYIPCGGNERYCPALSKTWTDVSAGYYSTGGTYATRTGQSICPIGSYCANGVKYACGGGTYSSTTGNSYCTACAAGTYNTGTGNTSCTACPAGTYNTGTSNTSCTDCPTGTYSTGTGNSSCTTCEEGKYNTGTKNTVACSLTCPAGYQCPNGVKSDCACGTYSASGSISCSTTAEGQYSYKNSGSPSNCSAGYYSSSGSCSCAACASGYTSAAGASSCFTCNAGYYYNGSACSAVGKGYYSPANQVARYQCGAGRYGNTTTNSASTCNGACKAGYYCPAGSTSATENYCTIGYYCPSGVGAPLNCGCNAYTDSGGQPTCKSITTWTKWKQYSYSYTLLDCLNPPLAAIAQMTNPDHCTCYGTSGN